MGIGVAAIVVAAHAHEGGRIVVGRALGSGRRIAESERRARDYGASDGKRDPVEEIAAGDAAVHAKVLVVVGVERIVILSIVAA